MCLGDIAQVVELVDQHTVRARVGDRLVTVSLMTLDAPVALGEWLQVHSGFALARLTEDERREAARIRNAPQEER
ncbi:HypC/HybG/HupF family hydrogenase formation chaperone [Nocardioides panacihumi]|uniref:HypC/HybG/HupF family hydrogenase formation chaperone n=1 Tax=Nocardioides panacihumi TaxID=400774 RepID=A0ABN2RV25_9ACTN